MSKISKAQRTVRRCGRGMSLQDWNDTMLAETEALRWVPDVDPVPLGYPEGAVVRAQLIDGQWYDAGYWWNVYALPPKPATLGDLMTAAGRIKPDDDAPWMKAGREALKRYMESEV